MDSAHRERAFALIAPWMEKYDTERPHSALGYLTLEANRRQAAEKIEAILAGSDREVAS